MSGDTGASSTHTWEPALAAGVGPRQTLRAGGTSVRGPEHTAPHRRSLDHLLVPEGDYRLGPVIGEGGMGTVSSALQRALGRLVALKRLRPDQALDGTLHARFLAEAALTADLAHPQVVPVHDLGTDADGMPFYTMKLVSGRPWDEVMHLLDLEQNLRILHKVCDAVAYAHSKGVLHRDLKPDNIMVGDFGEVLVLDWGLAVAFAPGTRAPRLGPDTPLAGTPAFMPPECALGEILSIGPASDIYLLGALLHVVLTGHPPHPGEDARACLLAAANNHIDPPPPQDALGRIAARAMATRPEDRHGDVQAFLHDLRGWREHRDSLALAREARLALARAMQSGSHQLYSDCVHGCEEALRRWEGNQEARSLLGTARRTWALAASARGDFALAESLLDHRIDGHAGALATVRASRQRAERARRRGRRLRGLLATAAALVALALAAGVANSLLGEQGLRQAQAAAARERARAAEAELAAHRARSEADALARRRAEAFPAYAEALDLLARGQLPVRAAALLRAATATDPGFTEAWYALGEALRLAGRPHEAVGAFHRADELARAAGGKPHLLALAHAGLALVESVDFRSAGAEFARLRAIASDDPLVEMGAIHLPGARFPEAMRAAVASTARAAAAAPHLWELQLAAGQAANLALEDGILDPAELRPAAIRALRQAYALAPSQPAVVIALAGCLRLNGTPAERAEGEALIAAATSANPSSPYLIGSDLLEAVSRRDLARAKGMLAHFRALDPPPAMAVMIDCFLALAEDSGGEAYQRAAEGLNAISHWPDFRGPAIMAGLGDPGRREQALKLWRAWREEPLDHPIKRFVAAQVARLSGDGEAEEREVAAGLAMAPWNARLLDMALVRATAAGRMPDLDLLRRFTAAAPTHRDGLAALVFLLHQAGRTEEARASLEQLRRMHPQEVSLLRRLTDLVGKDP